MKLWNQIWLVLTTGVICIAAACSGLTASAASGTGGNISANNYTTYGTLVHSYLIENSAGNLSRIEARGKEDGILIESYNVPDTVGKTSYITTGSHTVPYELPQFAGYYQGSTYHYLVFGQENLTESDTSEVLRVVKYNRNWTRVDSCSVYGINTYLPFTAGSLRMTEADGILYLHTCHTMYATSDGLRHQSNMTIAIDEETMTQTDAMCAVHNISVGYASHSFNQFIDTDGKYVYRVDHGDAYPRAVTITKFAAGDDITNVAFSQVFPIGGITGDNETGVSVGGFAISEENCLIVGNSVDQTSTLEYDAASQRNIFLSVTDQNLLQSDTIWLTDYTEEDAITPYTPQIVKINGNQFLILWEEYHNDTGRITTKMVTVNGSGAETSDMVSALYRLSDCQPIVTSDGLVKWYVTQEKGDTVEMTLYATDPNDLDAQAPLDKGDVDGDGSITIQDAFQALTAYARSSAGLKPELLDIQLDAADVDEDGAITITDAFKILIYYATNAVGNTPSWD